MKLFSSLPMESRPVVLFFARPSGLSVSVVELLLGNFCRVKIISDEKDRWTNALLHFPDRRPIEVLDVSETLNILSVDYILLINRGLKDYGRSNLKDEYKTISLAREISEKFGSNLIFVAPYLSSTDYQKKVTQKIQEAYNQASQSCGIVYLGQVLGSRMQLSENDVVSRAVKDFVTNSKINLPNGNVQIYPISISDGARAIIKTLFSFGGAGNEIAVVSRAVSVSEFKDNLEAFAPERQFGLDDSVWDTYVPKDIPKNLLPLNLKKSIKESLEWYLTHKDSIPKVVKRQLIKKIKKPTKEPIQVKAPSATFKMPKVRVPKIFYSRVSTFFLIAALIIFIPYLLFLLSGASLLVGKNMALKGKTKYLRMSASFAATSATVAKKELLVLGNLPLVGDVFFKSANIADLIIEVSSIAKKGETIMSLASDMTQKSLNKEDYDVVSYSEELSVELDSIYRDLSFIETELDENPFYKKYILERVLDKQDLSSIRSLVFQTSKVANGLPWILGADEKRTYLVLFQNNMELRPTGGFIGSFALVSFNKGKLEEISVQDVYSADGQLKGHVDPPEPIKNYLGEANWFLRDSNWDPDFTLSAERAEWFLDKEIDIKVDGVFGVDLEFAKSLVGVFGPITISDFGKEITSENLYEITQYEAEKDFFPGSRRKSSFLTSLVREVLLALPNTQEDKYFSLAQALFKDLNEKHLQIFLHNKTVQRAISELKWDGAVYQPSCLGNCKSDYLGVVEANVGVNKANYFIERSLDLSVELSEGVSTNTLLLNIKNSSNAVLGPEAKYKSYIRLIVPQEATFLGARLVSQNFSEDLDIEETLVRGRKEGGVLVNISSGQAKTVVFEWENPNNIIFSAPGEYGLVLRKQAGTNKDPIKVNIRLNGQNTFMLSPEASLTSEGVYSYNTNLARDFFSRIFW